MNDDRATDTIWANEGGTQLELTREPNGDVRFRFQSATGEWHADATIAQFRLRRIQTFMEPSLEAERRLYDPEDHEAK